MDVQILKVHTVQSLLDLSLSLSLSLFLSLHKQSKTENTKRKQQLTVTGLAGVLNLADKRESYVSVSVWVLQLCMSV